MTLSKIAPWVIAVVASVVAVGALVWALNRGRTSSRELARVNEERRLELAGLNVAHQVERDAILQDLIGEATTNAKLVGGAGPHPGRRARREARRNCPRLDPVETCRAGGVVPASGHPPCIAGQPGVAGPGSVHRVPRLPPGRGRRAAGPRVRGRALDRPGQLPRRGDRGRVAPPRRRDRPGGGAAPGGAQAGGVRPGCGRGARVGIRSGRWRVRWPRRWRLDRGRHRSDAVGPAPLRCGGGVGGGWRGRTERRWRGLPVRCSSGRGQGSATLSTQRRARGPRSGWMGVPGSRSLDS